MQVLVCFVNLSRGIKIIYFIFNINKGGRIMEPIKITSNHLSENEDLVRVAEESNVLVEQCYQCGKCTAGCPTAFAMDVAPHQIMHLLQLNLMDEALKSKTIWVCASCDTCSTRCPREVDIAKVMENLRIMAKNKGYISHKKTDLFHDIFLKSVERYGRVHEAGLIVGFNLFGMQPFKDVQFGPPMLLKGKISLLPHSIKGQKEVKKIFENVRKKGGGQL